MAINWYPGHMTTARKAAAESLRKVDLVIEVLDARVPQSSCNPVFETLRRQGNKPALKVLNKADAADATQTEQWLNHYKSQPGAHAVALCAKRPHDVRRLPALCQTLLPERCTSEKPLRMMILGIPNVGKSTLMNALLNRHVANVGDEPAITKMQMFHQLSEAMTLIDTPGMLWPGMTQEASYKLAATHSIGRAAYEDEDVAVDLGRRLLALYPTLLAQRFGDLPLHCDGHALLDHIAGARKFIKKGGGPDIAKASVALLNDFRAGTLGPITLDRMP